MRWLLVLALVGAASCVENSTYHHKVYRIRPENEDQLQFLQSLNDDEGNDWSYWKEPSTISKPVDLMVSPTKQSEFNSLMKSHGIAYDTLIENVEQLLIESETHHRSRRTSRKGTIDWKNYHTLEEINEWLKSLVHEFSTIVQPLIGGRSHEGRNIHGIKLSFHPGATKPGIFIEGGIHAREWISPATVTYLIDQLLRSKDPQIRALAEAHDWYIFPVFNPDGYHYTHENPKRIENRFWRKTRSPNSKSNCLGTDMNRNWGHKWRSCCVGDNAPNPCSETFAGSSAFSTIEAQTLSKYISSIANKLFAYVSFHSFAQSLMFPYGNTKARLDNYDEELVIAKAAVKALSRRYGTKYETGSIGQIAGLASGGSVDWVKATFKLPLVYTYELRDKGINGFLLSPDQIIPNGQEVLDSLVALFQEAKRFGYPRK